MNIVFVSNFLNHHQIPFCEKMIELCDNFNFIATQAGGRQGYQTTTDAPYVINYNSENKNKVENMIINADAVIFGACPNELIELRMIENKLSFLYSERFLKKGLWRRFIPTTRKKIEDRIIKYKNKNMYVLCASSYLSYELSLLNFPVEKCFKWGYFPNTKSSENITKKKNTILWAGRMLDWKHPEIAINIAERLCKDGYDFEMSIVGEGPQYSVVSDLINQKNLNEKVKLLGSKTHDELMDMMAESEIFLFTSDFKEGWGATLNEAMSNACAVVASCAAGSAPYLIKDGKNGLIFKVNDSNDAYEKVKYLLNNEESRQIIGSNAVQTIASLWNYEVAAERFVQTVKLLDENKNTDLFSDGPMSKAEIIKNSWYKGI